MNTIEEDEIDLRELFATIWNNKFKIVFFTFVVTSLTIAYTLSIPNSYKSETKLVSQTQAKPSLGGLSALAGMAGIDLGGGGTIDPATSFNTILNDFSFQKYMIEKYNLVNKLDIKKEDLVFALNYDGIYTFLQNKKKKEKFSKEELEYNAFQKLIKMISISTDKKSGMITLEIESTNRYLAKDLVEIYLNEITAQLRKIEMRSVEQQIEYYTKEMENTVELSMKDQLGQLASGLVQKKVLSQANEYYNVKQLTLPQVAYIKDKTKPKRALIVIVSFITSIILGIFIIFFLEFIKKEKS